MVSVSSFVRSLHRQNLLVMPVRNRDESFAYQWYGGVKMIEGVHLTEKRSEMGTLLLKLKEHDERVLRAMIARRRCLLDRAMVAVTHLGDAKVVITIASGLVLAPVPEVRALGVEVAFVLALSHLWVQILKRAVSRARPQLQAATQSLIEAPDRFSFPSGHAAASLATALPLAAVLPPSLSCAIFIGSAIVGLSRCYLGVHYPADVLMGWLLAGLAAWVATPTLTVIYG